MSEDTPPTGLSLYDYSATITCAREFNRRYWAAAGVGA